MCVLALMSVNRPLTRWSTRVANIHIAMLVMLLIAYYVLRGHLISNRRAPAPDRIDERCRSFRHCGVAAMIYEPPTRRRVIVLCCGVRDCVRRAMRYPWLRPLLRDSYILTFQPRGMGESEHDVEVTTLSMLQDALSMTDLIQESTLPLHLVGFSLGGFIALQLASMTRMPICSVTVVGTMYKAEMNNMLPHFYLACTVLGIRNDEVTMRVSVPKMIVHSSEDECVNIREAEFHRDARISSGLPTQMLSASGTHTRYTLSAESDRALRKFMKSTSRHA